MTQVRLSASLTCVRSGGQGAGPRHDIGDAQCVTDVCAGCGCGAVGNVVVCVLFYRQYV